ncbi:MAG: sulfide/dihydroorotate dehydrogenase-like FAD/NAD-binding protein, partial [Anaerolineae bacterium]|nr:sulfide/dihydroorotate dehydrogenase-like FAD/NAD-binding protein [Anaerolineae bacterium]
MYEILAKEELGTINKLMVIDAPLVARKAQAGQFVILRVIEEGERIPLTIADFDREKGTITLIFQEVGKSTMHLGLLEVGDELASFTGPLGRPTEIENYGTVVCVGGGVGIAPMYPITRALKEAGNEVLSIIG